jgi:DNA (cytosine-5)-methyltransferase 1
VFEFYEFFAGGGMARAGLGKDWTCTFANDFDAMKAGVYDANWTVYDPTAGSGHLLSHMHCCDVRTIRPEQLPGTADLAWASFPCQDLSLAGDYRGLGAAAAAVHTRSGTFWPFWSLMQSLGRRRRAPKTIVLENVYGALTSNGGRDFAAIGAALSDSGYRFGAVVINASLFVPQSRPRVFIVGARKDVHISERLTTDGPSERWHPDALLFAHDRLTSEARERWQWWKLPAPRKRTKTFADVIESEPTGVEWDSPEDTKRLLEMMTPTNRAKVTEAQKSGRPMIGGVYRRTRFFDGEKAQRAEVRFDDIAGCLRTPSGGSSRQRILVVDGRTVRSRLLSPREAVRLMGLPDSYKLPKRYNDAYHVAGDGVVVPVVRHLAKHIIEPMLADQEIRQAAE